MQRPSVWPMLVVLLLGILLLREPRFEKLEEGFLRWELRNGQPHSVSVPLTVVEIGSNQSPQKKEEASKDSAEAFLHSGGAAVSPLEYALFLQAVLEFKPTVIAFENILKWRVQDTAQEQVFLDQAMRVPKLLLGAELTTTPDPDAAPPDIPAFTQVSGSRSALVEFSGVGRQPNEDVRLISTPGFVNLPEEAADDLRVPLLFRYRGEVIPSFPLQAILLWLRITPAEVKVELGSQLVLPGERKIPILSNGTMLINPLVANNARRITLNELLLAAQQRDRSGTTTAHLEDIREHIVLARTPANPLSPPDVFAAAIATMQSNQYVRRISRIFDFVIVFAAILAAGVVINFSRDVIVLGAIAFTAGYCLLALGVISRFFIWLPGYLPLCTVWILVLIGLFAHRDSGTAKGPH